MHSQIFITDLRCVEACEKQSLRSCFPSSILAMDMKQLPDIITSFEGIVAYMKYARAFVLVIAARVFSRPSTSSFRARNVAFPIRFLNFFTASPATLATIGTGIFALIGIIFQAMSRLSCTFFQSDVSQCVGPRKF